LAAILIVTGFKLAGIPLFKQMWKSGKNQFVPFVTTIIAIVLTDLLIGLLIGMGVAIFFILPASLKHPTRRLVEKRGDGDILRIELANRVSFLNRASLMKTLHEIPNGTELVIDASSTIFIDPDILSSITDFEKQTAPARDLKLSLEGFKDPS
jgi:carbonic anhydrase/SulP family sulfate permease